MSLLSPNRTSGFLVFVFLCFILFVSESFAQSSHKENTEFIQLKDSLIRHAISKKIHGKKLERKFSRRKLKHIKELTIRRGANTQGVNRVETLVDLQFVPNLTRLRIIGAKVDAKLLGAFQPLKKLKTLVLMRTEIEDISFVKQLVGLTGLSLKQNNLKNIKPVASQKRLKILSLSQNNIRDVSPLSELKYLKKLYLSGNPIQKGVASLKSLEGLEKLKLQNCGITSLSFLKNLSRLKVLKLDHNRISTINKKYFQRLNRLEFLTLDSNRLNTGEVQKLSAIQTLNKLTLRDNKMKSIPDLSGLKKLHELELAGNPIHDIGRIRTVSSNLHVLSISIKHVDDFSPLQQLEPPEGNSVKGFRGGWLSLSRLLKGTLLIRLTGKERGVLKEKFENHKKILQRIHEKEGISIRFTLRNEDGTNSKEQVEFLESK